MEKRYNQEERINYKEAYALVAHLESIRLLLAFSCSFDFKLYQMDVKSTFLNNLLNKEVCVSQPPNFEDHENPDHVFKLKKAFYGIKQDP